MRLLHSTTLEFKDFFDAQIPPYVILSHTWGKEEVTYQDMRHLQKVRQLPASMRQNPEFMAALGIAAGIEFGPDGTIDIEARIGYQKIVKTAEIANSKGYSWFWIDTCCIDKSSSAELQEAINSMYAWYKRSRLCIVHLEGVFLNPSPLQTNWFSGSIESSKWMTRGWTLQELIAPRLLEFYDEDWSYLCHKTDVLHSLCRATGIPESVLITGEFASNSVAQKMSWAAHRSTTRLEDEAYALLGIFDVQMPMLYGEGDKAFLRLQEQIVRTTPDDSIFSWNAIGSKSTTYRGIFARPPREFAHCRQVTSGQGIFELSNLGLRITLNLSQVRSSDEGEFLVGQLQSRGSMIDPKIEIILRKLTSRVFSELQGVEISSYARTFPDSSFYDNLVLAKASESTVYVDVTPQLNPGLIMSAYHCFSFKRSHMNRSRESSLPDLTIVDAHPMQLWSEDDYTLLVPKGEQNFIGYVRLSPARGPAGGKMYTGTDERSASDVHLYVGLRQTKNNEKQAWAKTLPVETPDQYLENKTYEIVARKPAGNRAIKFDSRYLSKALGEMAQGRGIEMYYDLFRDEVSIMVEIQGLTRSNQVRHESAAG